MNSRNDLGITSIHHAGLPVADLEKALAFYVNVLGLEPIPAPGGFAAHVRWLRLGNQHLHLIQHDLRIPNESPIHVALNVKDVRAAKRLLQAQGFELDEAPFIENAERFYVRDPDGNWVELIQWFVEWNPPNSQPAGETPAPRDRTP